MEAKEKKQFITKITPERCKACGFCQEICPQDVFTRGIVYNSHGYQYMQVAQPEKCIGCLRCTAICPDFAITVTEK